MTSLANTIVTPFGTGAVFCQVSGQTPVKLGVLQDIELDLSAGVSELYGQNQFPVAVGRGKAKLSGKAKIGQFDVNMFNSLFYGGTLNTTQYRKVIQSEAFSAGSSVTTYTVANAGSSTIDDLGLYYSATGLQLNYSTAASPTVGNYGYTSSNGVYTLSTADATATAFLANYDYLSSGTGNQLLVANTTMGSQPVFYMELWEGFNSGTQTNWNLKLNKCISTKFSMPLKNSDFMVSDFEFSCFADSFGNVFTVGVGT